MLKRRILDGKWRGEVYYCDTAPRSQKQFDKFERKDESTISSSCHVYMLIK